MENGTCTETEQEKVDILNKFFSSIFTKDDETSVPLIDKQSSGSVLIDIDITEQMVLETLQSLKPSKSPGPDSLHPKVLREIAAQTANPLSIMFRASLQTGLIPDTCKLAHVTAIYEKGKISYFHHSVSCHVIFIYSSIHVICIYYKDSTMK